MSYEYFDEFLPLVTVRLPREPTDFRPAATAASRELAEHKAQMELAEVIALEDTELYPLSSAAHENPRDAAINAKLEAIERLSVAAWWTYRRPVDAKLEHEEATAIFPSSQGFAVNIGRVASAFGEGHAVVCVASNKQKFPYAVAGSAFDSNISAAVEKSVYETAQSWVGSQWLRQAIGTQPPGWDLKELSLRQQEIASAPAWSNSDDASIDVASMYLPPEFKLSEGSAGKVSVALISHDAVRSHRSFEIASLAARPEEAPQIFSRFNW